MKKVLLLILLLPCSIGFKVFAQDTFVNSVNNDLLAKYIEAAKHNNLPKRIADKRAEGIKTNIPITVLSYLDIANVSYIYRPSGNQAVAPVGNTSNPYAFNGIQYGVSLSLGTFLAKPYQIKAAKINYEVARMEADQYGITLETEVKNRYYNYVQAVALLKLSTQNLQDMMLLTESMKTKFENGTATLDAYDQSRTNLNAAKNTQINSDVVFMKSRDALEEIIGKKLTEIQ